VAIAERAEFGYLLVDVPLPAFKALDCGVYNSLREFCVYQ
jgi:hypothetical protein